MRYGLARLTGNRTLVEISHAEFARVVSARQVVGEILGIEEDFVLLIENHRELEIEALGNTLRNATFPIRPWSEMISDIHLFNRRVVNLLTTARLYLDHIPHHLTAIFGCDESVKQCFRAACSKRYDASFSYRLMEELRNFVQHRGLPLSGLRRNSRWVNIDDHNASMENTLELYVERAQLIADPKFKKIAKELQAIENKDESIDLRPRIREYVALISEVHEELRIQLNQCFDEASATVGEYITRFTNGDEELELGLHVVQLDSNGRQIIKYFLDRNPARRRTEIVGRYSHLKSITRQHTTSAPSAR